VNGQLCSVGAAPLNGRRGLTGAQAGGSGGSVVILSEAKNPITGRTMGCFVPIRRPVGGLAGRDSA
jgi:hypothetical protein